MGVAVGVVSLNMLLGSAEHHPLVVRLCGCGLMEYIMLAGSAECYSSCGVFCVGVTCGID